MKWPDAVRSWSSGMVSARLFLVGLLPAFPAGAAEIGLPKPSGRRILPRKNGRTRIPARKSSPCLFLLGAGVLLLGLMFTYAHFQRLSDAPSLDRVAAVAERLELTDLALFTEARYTRHPSQADLYSAFQDHPISLEHFPMGSIAGPPGGLRRLHDEVD